MASVLKPKQNDSSKEQKPPGITGLAGFNLDDFADAGIRHLKSVESQAEKILADAREEAKKIHARAAEQGERDGFQAGVQNAESKIRNDVQEELGKRIPGMENALQQLADLQESYLNEFQASFLELVLYAVERIVLTKLDSDAEIITRWAQAAIDAAKSSKRLSLAVHPETLASHGDLLERLLVAPGLPEDAGLEADESIDPEGVEVRTDGGSVLLTLKQQIGRLEEMLRGEMQSPVQDASDLDAGASESDTNPPGDAEA